MDRLDIYKVNFLLEISTLEYTNTHRGGIYKVLKEEKYTHQKTDIGHIWTLNRWIEDRTRLLKFQSCFIQLKINVSAIGLAKDSILPLYSLKNYNISYDPASLQIDTNETIHNVNLHNISLRIFMDIGLKNVSVIKTTFLLLFI